MHVSELETLDRLCPLTIKSGLSAEGEIGGGVEGIKCLGPNCAVYFPKVNADGEIIAGSCALLEIAASSYRTLKLNLEMVEAQQKMIVQQEAQEAGIEELPTFKKGGVQ